MGPNLDSAAKFLDRFADSWGRGDGRALGDQFTEDGSLINPFGQRADGRTAITAMYGEYFGGMLAGTSSSIEVESIRPVGESAAFVDARQTILGPDGNVVLVVHLTAVLAREGEEWRFTHSRPYTFSPVPG